MSEINIDGDELLVSGYIRENTIVNIANEIILLIFKWYKIQKDYWNLIEKGEAISIDDNQIATGKYSTCVGSIIISKSTPVQTWKLKLLKFIGLAGIVKGSYLAVGIISTVEDHKGFDDELYEHNGYGLDFFSGIGYHNSKAVAKTRLFPKSSTIEGDIITIKYERISAKDDGECHGALYFGYNDEDLRRIFDNIPTNDGQEYRFGLSFQAEESVQLL